jgi:hypothetical protein
MRSLLFLSIVIAGCSQPNAAAEMANLGEEVARLKAEVGRLAAENARLQQTEDGLWERAVQSDEANNFDVARDLFRQFEARFPTSSRALAVPLVVAKLDDRQCSVFTEKASTGLASKNREAVEALAHLLLDDGAYDKACHSKDGAVRLKR